MLSLAHRVPIGNIQGREGLSLATASRSLPSVQRSRISLWPNSVDGRQPGPSGHGRTRVPAGAVIASSAGSRAPLPAMAGSLAALPHRRMASQPGFIAAPRALTRVLASPVLLSTNFLLGISLRNRVLSSMDRDIAWVSQMRDPMSVISHAARVPGFIEPGVRAAARTRSGDHLAVLAPGDVAAAALAQSGLPPRQRRWALAQHARAAVRPVGRSRLYRASDKLHAVSTTAIVAGQSFGRPSSMWRFLSSQAVALPGADAASTVLSSREALLSALDTVAILPRRPISPDALAALRRLEFDGARGQAARFTAIGILAADVLANAKDQLGANPMDSYRPEEAPFPGLNDSTPRTRTRVRLLQLAHFSTALQQDPTTRHLALSMTDMAILLDRARTTVQESLGRNMPDFRSPMSQQHPWRQEALELARQGVPLAEVSRRLNRPVETLRRALSHLAPEYLVEMETAQAARRAESRAEVIALATGPSSHTHSISSIARQTGISMYHVRSILQAECPEFVMLRSVSSEQRAQIRALLLASPQEYAITKSKTLAGLVSDTGIPERILLVALRQAALDQTCPLASRARELLATVSPVSAAELPPVAPAVDGAPPGQGPVAAGADTSLLKAPAAPGGRKAASPQLIAEIVHLARQTTVTVVHTPTAEYHLTRRATMEEIANQLGCSFTVVRQTINRLVPEFAKSGARCPSLEAYVLDLALQTSPKLSLSEISRRAGFSRSAINAILARVLPAAD
ncbi:hypothetical protein H696_04164 [Fonticula alba]|uniref:Uncharacterized protein n=1 Tax=Fonticula alba TaxID=691883 RepID=A0A058Z654_FONAL|nr:hypothetical protein H696_04164 [Fonticula alba]KCV69755.1 hypothetical protein H696_04164 [Fonticula alba]|eukprot:XP_009496320.1 hypothetical protein H696_04164 [Fonticula alba]